MNSGLFFFHKTVSFLQGLIWFPQISHLLSQVGLHTVQDFYYPDWRKAAAGMERRKGSQTMMWAGWNLATDSISVHHTCSMNLLGLAFVHALWSVISHGLSCGRRWPSTAKAIQADADSLLIEHLTAGQIVTPWRSTWAVLLMSNTGHSYPFFMNVCEAAPTQPQKYSPPQESFKEKAFNKRTASPAAADGPELSFLFSSFSFQLPSC